MTRTVCVIDDDCSVQRALRRLLEVAGYRVLLCSSAAEFLELTDLPHPICLIIDVRMPGMTGIDLQAALIRENRHIPVIMVSGHADESLVLRASHPDMVAFLSKPFEDDALLHALAAAMPADRPRGYGSVVSRE